MFIVNLFGQKQLYLNSKTEDFISGVKKLYECSDEDLEAYYVDEADQILIRREMRLHPEQQYEFDLENKKLLLVRAPIKMIGELKNEASPEEGVFRASDEETKIVKTEVLSFSAKKVLKFNYSSIKNQNSGETYQIVDSIELEP